jgi:DNA-directed RNA polymerase specialized sigma24 family protein
VAATPDPHDVGRHDDEKLRRFLAARRAGDEAGARHWWEELLADNFDRVYSMVRVYSRGHLSHDEQQEALQRALIRLANNMIVTFRGTSMGEWVESTRALVKFACLDTQRRAAALSKHERSLDQPGREDEDTGRWDADVYQALEKQRQEQEIAEEDADAIRDGQVFLDWAVPQLSDKRRAVIELDRADVPVEEIQVQLGVSRDAVYASRSRALKDLGNLRDEYQR